ncbi:MATE family efflux transporter [Pseudoteredinibacter isoporae]|uniref:Multidrug-efflux transporter n=1 Tax=Pseudoteredinibacter isoporae TaxID=570281 RepID=A0A7X0JVB8_9GAMM|nr:MATE family efflux transporter [Pseudoteredinibacter isoporae]MBB6522832.1 putative MATE family efflux protein [Pseudoteredinibacter isoporae]NHO88359.1 MATE family efflux transporter [Pseudoteredinibacter isoporae]NIB23310.1 MATE family efflux transporter [Pseudoteredinibacter isoporae]
MSSAMQATLTQGSVGKTLREMAAPMVIGLLAMMSFNAVDTFFVGQLGEDALAAMSFTFPVVMVYTSLAIGLGAGTSSCVARAIGTGDQDTAKRLLTDVLTIAFLLSVVFGFLGWWFMEPTFYALGASEQLMPLIREYMDIWFLGVPMVIMPMAAMAGLRAMGLSKLQGVLMGVSALANGLLDPLLIFGLWGFPRLELAGAAWASFIVRIGVLLAVAYILIVRLQVLASPFVAMPKLIASWRQVFHVAIPAMGTNVIIPLASAIVVAMVAGYGEAAVAGLGVALRVEPIVLICFYALSAVMGPFFGQNLSASAIDRVREAQSVAMRFCLAMGLAVAALLFVGGEWLAGLFSDSPEVIAVAKDYLLLVPISYGCYGMVMYINAAFNGIGKPMPGLVISSLRVLGLYLPIAWVAMEFWGLIGLFVATAVTNILVGLIGYFWLRRHVEDIARVECPA